MDIAAAISDYGFPIIAAMGMGYFIFYVWKWVTTEINPKIGEASSTLIRLVDRVRMLDNDMIRLNTKLSMVLEYQGDIKKVADQKDLDDLDDLLHKYKSFSQGFDSTGNNK
jgi:hypothetical protein